MKKIILLFFVITLTSCTNIKDNAGKLKPNIGTCPPKEDRNLGDIFCKEPK